MPEVTHVGKALFGNPTRLRLALWIFRHDKRFFQSEPPASVGAPTAVRQALDNLVELDMLECQQPPGEKCIFYERTSSSLWQIVEVADRVLDQSASTDSSTI